MSNCTIPGCTAKVVAWGLCAKHYMRKRRRGDPNAEFKRGRQLKPRPEDPVLAALRFEIAELREQNAALRHQLEEAQPPPGGGTWDKLAAVTKENERLTKQLADVAFQIFTQIKFAPLVPLVRREPEFTPASGVRQLNR